MINNIIKKLDGQNKKFMFSKEFDDIIKLAKDNNLCIAYCVKNPVDNEHHMYIVGALTSDVGLYKEETKFYVYESETIPANTNGMDSVWVKLGKSGLESSSFGYFISSDIKNVQWFKLVNDDCTTNQCGFVFNVKDLKIHI